MVSLLIIINSMVISHGYVSHNQMVNPLFSDKNILAGEHIILAGDKHILCLPI